MRILNLLIFLSTLSLRRATDQNSGTSYSINISIHALLAESDLCLSISVLWMAHFYPRSPCGERRVTVLGIQHRVGISIHALLAESDYGAGSSRDPARDFYPRSPCGERLARVNSMLTLIQFLSTLSLRRATQCPPYHGDSLQISIHALLAESDNANDRAHGCRVDFYPRSPCGERLMHFLGNIRRLLISIHALLAESDSVAALRQAVSAISIHALLAESDPLSSAMSCFAFLFLSTLSLRRATQPARRRIPDRSHFYPRSPCGERHFRCPLKRSISNFYPRSPCGERLRKVPILGIK